MEKFIKKVSVSIKKKINIPCDYKFNNKYVYELNHNISSKI